VKELSTLELLEQPANSAPAAAVVSRPAKARRRDGNAPGGIPADTVVLLTKA
jgi:hypothetical protein